MQALLFWEPASKRSKRQNLLFSEISSSSFLWAILDEDQMQCPMERLSPTSDLVENVLVIVLRAVSKFLFLLYGGCYLLIARVALHDLYLESN
ncbi:hypothetical protein NC651_023201 [Populus alba x Populus x berolinensis]|nr:hypothetical protein NC651_023201 [Populus alba x Populus x berolinensis]